MRKLILVVLALVAANIVLADQSTSNLSSIAPYMTLKDRRADGEMVFPVYSSDEKDVVANQAQLLIEKLYVHKELKKKKFGVNPDPELDHLQPLAGQMADAPLNRELSNLFLRERDLHTVYSFPKPLQCYSSYLLFILNVVTDAKGHDALAILNISKDSEALKLSPDISKLSSGDVLVEYEGKNPFEAIKEFKLDYIGSGANSAADVRRGVEKLTFRNHRTMLLPFKDSIHVKFQKIDGTTADLNLPWISFANLGCLNATLKPKANMGMGSDVQRLNLNDIAKPYRFVWDDKRTPLLGATVPTPNKLADFSSPKITAEPIISYKKLQNQNGYFGYLRLDSFLPSKLSEDESLNVIRNLLQNEFADTKGLIIDLRGNGGGQISFGQSMIQLFTPVDVQPEGFRLVADETNLRFLQNVSFAAPSFLKFLEKALAEGKPMTEPNPLEDPSESNRLGQSYFKPVAILTNSSCYSTCDMFTAGMQDHGVAKIWGEDGHTGGGGANNMAQSDFYNFLPKDNKQEFKPLPGGQEMGIAWRQAVRVGPHAGQLLEDTGVVADEIIPPTPEDIVLNNLITANKMTSDLAKKSEKKTASIRLTEGDSLDFPATGARILPTILASTDEVDFRQGGVVLEKQPVTDPGTNAQQRNLDLGVLSKSLNGNTGYLDILGFEKAKRVWKKIILYRFVPDFFVVDQVPYQLELGSGSREGNLTFYTINEDQDLGWNIKNNQLQVGDGTQYQNNVHTKASLFFDISKVTASTFNFEVEVHSEEGFDFFSVTAVSEGVSQKLLGPMSGQIANQKETVDLAAMGLAGKKVEIQFIFDSDGGVTDKGVFVKNIELK